MFKNFLEKSFKVLTAINFNSFQQKFEKTLCYAFIGGQRYFLCICNQ